VGTSKVCALIGELSRDGNLTIHRQGRCAASGLKKAVVINIEQTTRSSRAPWRRERLSGYQIELAYVGVGGQHVESRTRVARSRSAVTNREVNRERT